MEHSNPTDETILMQQRIRAMTTLKRQEREARTMEATRQLHVEAGRDPDKALDPCSKEEFERLNAHAQMVSRCHREQAGEKDEAYEKYKADLAKSTADLADAIYERYKADRGCSSIQSRPRQLQGQSRIDCLSRSNRVLDTLYA